MYVCMYVCIYIYIYIYPPTDGRRLNNAYGGLYCPNSLVPHPQNFLNFQKL